MPFQKGNSFGGRQHRKSNASQGPTPKSRRYAFDEDMMQEDADETQPGTSQRDDDDGDAGSPHEDNDADTPPSITTIPRRKRGRGALRTGSRARHGTPDLAVDDASESGTPARRKRGRPFGSGRGSARGGFRGRRRGGAPPETPRVVDKEGNTLDVINDEAQVDEDDEGNAKVDEFGNLLGGREYRVRTFKIIGRGERLYMLSTEPARCCGFRDSYLFFAKHPKLYKVLTSDAEKKDLIERDILPSSYKGRNIGVVTARSVYREFGARIIVGGRKITDDYKVTAARASGVEEGQLADPEDRVPDNKDDYNRNRYVAWFGASDVYRNTAPGANQASKPGLGGGRRRNNITVQNWQSVHAREASRFNSFMTVLRRENLNGVYETHTNMMFFPKITQPTHAGWDQIPASSTAMSGPQQLTGDRINTQCFENGVTGSHDDDPMDVDQPAPHLEQSTPTSFSAVPPVVSRNFTVVDTAMVGPPVSGAGYPGPDGLLEDPTSGPNGLGSISDDVVNELPADCRKAFEEARAVELAWKRRWGTETQSGFRGDLKIGLNAWPA